jgi:type 1 glutamine amidotransferase
VKRWSYLSILFKVTHKQSEYYTHYPPAEMNVRVIEEVQAMHASGKTAVKRQLVSKKAFNKGDIIFEELPMVSALKFSLEVIV